MMSDDTMPNDAIERQDTEENRVVADEVKLGGDIVRLTADLENLKKDVLTQNAESAKRAIEFAIRAMAPALDALELAHKATQNGSDDEELKRWRDGLKKVRDRFEQAMLELGIVPVPVDGNYDPKFHEAVERVPGEQYQIMEVVGLGWMWKDDSAIIVPAKVHVGSDKE